MYDAVRKTFNFKIEPNRTVNIVQRAHPKTKNVVFPSFSYGIFENPFTTHISCSVSVVRTQKHLVHPTYPLFDQSTYWIYYFQCLCQFSIYFNHCFPPPTGHFLNFIWTSSFITFNFHFYSYFILLLYLNKPILCLVSTFKLLL